MEAVAPFFHFQLMWVGEKEMQVGAISNAGHYNYEIR